MANHKSSEKRARQTIKRTARNAQNKKNVRTFEKKLVSAIETKSAEIETTLREFTKKIMQAVSKGTMKKETASRKISRLSVRANKASGPQAEATPVPAKIVKKAAAKKAAPKKAKSATK